MRDFAGRVAVVTGAASGIGFALAPRCVDLGMHVAAADVDARRLAEAIETLGPAARGFAVDVADREAMSAFADQVFDLHGGVHLLCNNAGVTVRRSLLDATYEDWDFVMGVDVYGVVHGIGAFLPRMLAQGDEGHVVNTGSIASFVAGARHGIYCAAKHAVAAISASLAEDLAERGARIGVSVVCPGAVRTRFAEPGREPRGMEAPDVAAAIFEGVREQRLFVFPDAGALGVARERMRSILGNADLVGTLA